MSTGSHSQSVSRDSSLFSSPLVQAGLLGTAAYFGTKGLYNRFARNPMYQNYINSIQDPEQRERARAQYEGHMGRSAGRWAKGAAALGAAIPLFLNRGSLASGWREGSRVFGNPGSGSNPEGGLYGTFAATLGGDRAVKGMRETRQASQRDTDRYMEKSNAEKSYIYDFYKRSSEYNDAFAGKDFVLPYVRPLSTAALRDIPVASSIGMVATPNNAQIMGHENAYGIIKGLNIASDGKGAGLISTNGLVKGLARAGFGWAVGRKLGDALGTVFSQPPQVKQKLKQYGAIGGIVYNLGIVQ